MRSAPGACPVCGAGLWLDDRGRLRCLRGGCEGPEGAPGGTPLEDAVPAAFPKDVFDLPTALGLSAPSPYAPTGGVAPPLQCNRVLRGPLEAPEAYCGRPAEWHVLWDREVNNGLCCQEHYEEVCDRWVYLAAHEYDMACSMPGAVYDPGRNVCLVDQSLLGL